MPKCTSLSLWDQDTSYTCCWLDHSCDITDLKSGFVPALAEWVSVAQKKFSNSMGSLSVTHRMIFV